MDISIPSSYDSPKIRLSSIQTIEEKTRVIHALLEQEILCTHDVNELNDAYKTLSQLEQQSPSLLQKKSHDIANQIAEKIQAIHNPVSLQRMSAQQIITSYYLKQFEVFKMDLPLDSSFYLLLTANKIKDIAIHLPCCRKINDEEILLGKELSEEVFMSVESKKDQICKKKEIQKRVNQLHQLKEQDPHLYPSYLQEILDRGCLHLYDHLINMKQISTSAGREIKEKELSFSAFSHIILEFKKIALAKAEELIPQGSNTLFILGDTGSGKSTTFCYLRKDQMILQNRTYQSRALNDHLIGNNQQLSCTLFPNISISSDLTLVDFPGFNDTQGKVIGLAIELTLRALVKKYSPKVLVLYPITDKEGKFDHAVKLGQRLKRILGELTHGTLGLTKYSQDTDMIEIKNIENMQRQKLSQPTREEISLEGAIGQLLALIEEMPHLQDRVDQKKKELLELQQKRLSSAAAHLPDTEEKGAYWQAIHEKEAILKINIGIEKMISLANLTDQEKLENLLDGFKSSQHIPTLSRYHHLDSGDKNLLDVLVKDKLISLMTTQKKRPLSSLSLNPSEQKLSKNKFLDQVKAFEKNILDTSLINTLLAKTHPEIGEFFHLEEMDPAIVRAYDKRMMKSCIEEYLYEVIVDLNVLEEVIEKLKSQFKKDRNEKLDKQLTSLKKYISMLSLGISMETDEAKVIQAWATLQKKHQSRIDNRAKDLEISKFMTGVLIAALGIPYGLFALFKNNELDKAHRKSMKEITHELCECIQDITGAIEHLKEIEGVVNNKDQFDAVFLNYPLILDSISSLQTSLDQQIEEVKKIYGKPEWEAKVFLVKEHIQEKFSFQRGRVLYAMMAQEAPLHELPPYFNDHTFLALMHAFSTSQRSYQVSLKQLIPGWEAAYPLNLELTNPHEFFYVHGMKEQEYEKLKAEGKLLLEKYHKTPVTRLLLIDALQRLRKELSPMNRDESQSRLNFSLENDKEKIIKAIKNNPWVLEFCKEWVKKDKELMLATLEGNEKAFMFASEALKSDQYVVLAAVRKNGKALEFASEALKSDRYVVLDAVRQNGKALEFASEALKSDRYV
ncbi:MAG: DUF4116 domain-containing protein, partial [Candidatus Rhabdochlamydia sp.]